MYYNEIIVSTCLITLIIFIVVLSIYAVNMQKDFNNKMRKFTDQINNSQFYQYELDKKSHDKIKILDTNVSDIRTNYIPRSDFQDHIVTNNLDVGNKAQAYNMNVDGSLSFGNNMSLENNNNSLNLTLPQGSSMNIQDDGGKSFLNITDRLKASDASINNLSISDKWKLSADDKPNTLSILSKDHNGFILSDNLHIKNTANLDGQVNFTGNINSAGTLNAKGGVSEHNPNNWQTHLPWAGDNKNYIRGDTELRGNTNTIGDINIGRDLNLTNGVANINNIISKKIKVGHNWENEWINKSKLTVYSPDVGASFGDEYWSHFGYGSDTYIRPPKSKGNIIIGDIGNTSSIQLGDSSTKTNVKGTLCIQDSCISKADIDKIKKLA